MHAPARHASTLLQRGATRLTTSSARGAAAVDTTRHNDSVSHSHSHLQQHGSQGGAHTVPVCSHSNPVSLPMPPQSFGSEGHVLADGNVSGGVLSRLELFWKREGGTKRVAVLSVCCWCSKRTLTHSLTHSFTHSLTHFSTCPPLPSPASLLCRPCLIRPQSSR